MSPKLSPKRPQHDPPLRRRGRRWWTRVYVPGKGKVYLACCPRGQSHATTDRATARVIARRLRDELLGPVPRPATDLETILAAFRSANALTASATQAARNAAVIRRFLAARSINDPAAITPGHVQQYLAHLAARGAAPRTLQNHRSAISTFWRFLGTAFNRDDYPGNPVTAVPVRPPKRRPARFLTTGQIADTLAAAESIDARAMAARRYADLADAIRFVLLTGLRLSELRRLAWRDVDVPGRRLLVKLAKGDQYRLVWLGRKALAVLAAQRARTGRKVYCWAGRERQGATGLREQTWFTDAMRAIQKAIPAFTDGAPGKRVGRGWHLLRHTHASQAVQRGIPLAKIRAWLGHADIRTTDIYAHLAPGFDPDIERIG